MKNQFSHFIVAIGIAAILGGFIGGIGAYWYFFWKNREMCACAPQGIEGGENLEAAVAEPYSDVIMRNRVITYSVAGSLIGTSLGFLFLFPGAHRLQRALNEIENDEGAQ
ncbi:MAG: hypothetical protein JXX29_14430 [Deltaproteobacteria bacterium]|nr:hypothetical protein [Deltaproteobacteria bacterium]MBN2672876.1 hypothetical protein [Deltaproteobacteria bacterium]